MTRGDFDVIPARGPYRICKAGRRRDSTHDRFATAEAAALRLVEDHPGETFIITQEVARVRAHRPHQKGRP